MSSFVKSFEDIKRFGGKPTTFFDAEMLTIYWETKPEIIARILPKCLKPIEKPIVSAFIANYPRTNFAPPYKEAGLFILADYNGAKGNYCLSMPITDGVAMAMGREVCGLPKKMADIELVMTENSVEGSISRNGIKFVEMSAKLNGKMNDPQGESIINEYYGTGVPFYNIKYSKSVDGNGFDLMPTLVSQALPSQNKVVKPASVSLKLTDSPHDPWIELEVVNMLGGIYTVGDNILERGVILEKIDPMQYLPYSFIKWDWWENKL